MKDAPFHAVFTLCLLLLPGATLRADDIVDIEDVPTPLSLAELLPEGGVDSVAVDYWLTMTMRDQAGLRVGGESYYHWSITPENGQLVFEYRYGFSGANSRHTYKKTVYTAEGKLVQYHELTRYTSGLIRTTTGKPIENELELTTATRRKGQAATSNTNTRRLPLAVDGTVPLEWLPLVIAYHARVGSLGYRYSTINASMSNQRATNVVADLGVEQAEVDGQSRRAHLLTLERTNNANKGKDDKTRIKMLVLESGEVLSMQSDSERYQLSYQHSTREAVVKRFALDPHVLEPPDDQTPQ